MEGFEGLIRFLLCGASGKGVEVGDEVRNVVVAGVRLETEAVLERDGEGDQEVEGGSVIVSIKTPERR